MRKDKRRYVYHVYYIYLEKNQTGYGSVTIYRENKINTESEVESVQEFIRKEYELDSVIIANFILLNTRGE